MHILSIKNLSLNFGGLWAVKKFSLDAKENEITSIIGPNGAGKTTLFNMITGVYEPSEGEIIFNGTRIDGLAPFKINNNKILRTFQNIRLFNHLTVEENLQVPFISHYGLGVRFAFNRCLKTVLKDAKIGARIDQCLEEFELQAYKNEKAISLSHGHQRILEIARAYINRPKLLLLDEPSAGLSGKENTKMERIVHRIKSENTTILVIEHNLNVIKSISDKIAVMDFGEKIAEGPYEEISKNKKVIEAYLGVE
jgi:branched-chain amino acid transport system ATP-binding protein